jgi:hypothetical protein
MGLTPDRYPGTRYEDEIILTAADADAGVAGAMRFFNGEFRFSNGVVTYTPLKSGAGDFNTYPEKLTPVAADILLLEDSAASYAKKKVQVGNLPGPSSAEANATGDTTTTSLTDVLVNAMTLTPAAGTYLVLFTGSAQNDSATSMVWANIYAGGTLVGSSEREMGLKQADNAAPFACVARVTVNGAQTIEGRWRTDKGTATMHERSLAILKVG